MTRRLLSIKEAEKRYTVYVKPEVVMNVAFNEIQKNTHDKSGFSFRFVRIRKKRDK